jgi:hypothetical protein
MNDPVQKEAPLSAPINMDLFVERMRAETGLGIEPAGMVATTPRQVMQYFGTEYVRKIQDDFWIQKVLKFVRSRDRVLIADCRFINEADAIRSIGGHVIRVVRLDLPVSQDLHPSEAQIGQIEPDLLIGKLSSNLTMQTRIARLLSMNRFSSCKTYDYRRVEKLLELYGSGVSIERCVGALGVKHKGPDVVKFILSYYGYASSEIAQSKQSTRDMRRTRGIVGKSSL